MTVVTKTIGRLPVNLGDYDGTRAYGRKNRCLQYGCEVESLVDNNTYAPFTWDGDRTFTLDDAHWRLISGNPEVWAASHPKPATTGTTGDYPYNGMGRVILPKNMVNIAEEGEPENIVNLLTQDMFYKGEVGSRVPNTNTIFVIQYDFVLGEDIAIPDSSVLEFDGGSISGAYTITGQQTKIIAGLVKIFNTNVILAGTIDAPEAYPEWFGAISGGVEDCTTAIQKTLDYFDNVVLYKQYKFTEINIYYGVKFTAHSDLYGNINITHSQNTVNLERLWGTLTIGAGNVSDICMLNTVRFKYIRPENDGDGIVLDASLPRGVQNNSIYGGLIMAQNNKTFKCGICLKAVNSGNNDVRSFCNQNYFYGILISGATEHAIYLNNMDGSSNKAAARMNGNSFYGCDTTVGGVSIKMSQYVERNVFYSHRVEEMDSVVAFGTGCTNNRIYPIMPVISNKILYYGTRHELDNNDILGRLVTPDGNEIWNGKINFVGNGSGNVVFYSDDPSHNNRMVTLTDDVVCDAKSLAAENIYNASIFNGNHYVFLDQGYINGGRKINALVNNGEVPPMFMLPYQGCAIAPKIHEDVEFTEASTMSDIMIKEWEVDFSEAKEKVFICMFAKGYLPSILRLRFVDGEGQIIDAQTITLSEYPAEYIKNASGMSGIRKVRLYASGAAGTYKPYILLAFDAIKQVVLSTQASEADEMYNIRLLGNTSYIVEKNTVANIES